MYLYFKVGNYSLFPVNKERYHCCIYSNGNYVFYTLTQYAATLHTHGMPTRSVVGFLDCTIHLTCQLSMSKTFMYMGYKKCHGMKFQGIVVPNRMITHLAGLYHAPQNNAGVLAESHLLKLMHKHMIQPGLAEGDPPEWQYFQLYGNSVYGVSAILMSPHAWVRALTAVKCTWNMGMGEVCISVKHVFGIVLHEWPFLCSSWKHQVFGTSVGEVWSQTNWDPVWTRPNPIVTVWVWDFPKKRGPLGLWSGHSNIS